MTKSLKFPTFALLGLLLAVPQAARAQQKDTERVDRTVQIRAGGQLRLKNFSGRVTITGSNRADMAVHAVRRATRDRLEHIKLDIEETGSGVTIEANRKDSDWHDRENNVVDTEFNIEVPADISLDVEVFSSDVEVKDVRGRQRVHTFSGNIELSGGEKDVNAETFSGDINVKLTQGAAAAIDFDSFSGSLNSDVPMNYRSTGRRHVRADIGAGGNDYSFKTFSGDLRIR
jgi:DUF4097 and DUF4098 domain-containing protein YvlB